MNTSNRLTPMGPSVSWEDSGLPVFIPDTSCNMDGLPKTPEEGGTLPTTARGIYQTFLLRLVEREIEDREVRARERRIKAAEFPVKTLDNFDFKAQPSIDQPLIRELMSGEYIDRHENVLLIGNSGTGKTHLGNRVRLCLLQ